MRLFDSRITNSTKYYNSLVAEIVILYWFLFLYNILFNNKDNIVVTLPLNLYFRRSSVWLVGSELRPVQSSQTRIKSSN